MKILFTGLQNPSLLSQHLAENRIKTPTGSLNKLLTAPDQYTLRFGHQSAKAAAERATLQNEIELQPKILLNLTQKALNGTLFSDLYIPKDVTQLAAVAEGSSYNALAIAKDTVEQLTGRPFAIHLPHDIESKLTLAQQGKESAQKYFPKNPLWITVSQSGKSSNLVDALSKLSNSVYKKSPSEFPVSIFTNHPEEKLGQLFGNQGQRKVAVGLEAGDENSVPATKSMTSSIMMVLLFANYFAKQQGKVDEPTYQNNLKSLHQTAQKLEHYFSQGNALKQPIENFAKALNSSNYFVLLSRGPVAKVLPEVALKLRESSRNVTFFDNTDSFKHGSAPILSGVKNDSSVILPNTVYWVPNQPELAKQLYSDVQEHFYKGGNTNHPLFPTQKIFFIRTENTPEPPANLKQLLQLKPEQELVLPNSKAFASATDEQFLALVTYQLIANSLCQVKQVSPNDPALSKVVLSNPN